MMNGERFKQIRLSRGLTQEQFADLLGMGRSTVANIEAGRSTVSPRTRARLAQMSDISEVFSFLDRLHEIDKMFPIK